MEDIKIMDKNIWLLVQLEYASVLASSKDPCKLRAWVNKQNPWWREGDDYKIVCISKYYLNLDE